MNKETLFGFLDRRIESINRDFVDVFRQLTFAERLLASRDDLTLIINQIGDESQKTNLFSQLDQCISLYNQVKSKSTEVSAKYNEVIAFINLKRKDFEPPALVALDQIAREIRTIKATILPPDQF